MKKTLDKHADSRKTANMSEGRVKLSVAARMLGISYRLAQTMSYAGDIPTIVTKTRRRFVPLSWLRTQIEVKDQPNAG
ncbi:MAG: hypothetical protein WC551_13180 [Patescibacteria group bacterium]